MSGQASQLPARTSTAQPNTQKTKKDQKGFQLGPEYNAQEVNAEFDRLHKRVNDVVIENPVVNGAELSPATNNTLAGGSTTAQMIARINTLTALLEKAGLLKTS